MVSTELTALANPKKIGEYSQALIACNTLTASASSASSNRLFFTDNSDQSSSGNNDEIQKKFNLKVYPNPTNGEWFFAYELPSGSRIGEFVLYDITGHLMWKKELSENSAVLKYDEKQLSSGVYFYKLSADGNTLKTDKLVILK